MWPTFFDAHVSGQLNSLLRSNFGSYFKNLSQFTGILARWVIVRRWLEKMTWEPSLQKLLKWIEETSTLAFLVTSRRWSKRQWIWFVPAENSTRKHRSLVMARKPQLSKSNSYPSKFLTSNIIHEFVQLSSSELLRLLRCRLNFFNLKWKFVDGEWSK